jgi:riboflavin synthase
MFTGLVAMMGKVISQTPEGAGKRLALQAALFDQSIEIGESIAVNGVCLTVVETQEGRATFQLAPETLQRSNLGKQQPGSLVNLERSLRLGDRLGGHWVQGHVDGVSMLKQRDLKDEWEEFTFQMPINLGCYLVPKGSITVNGVSLTLVDVASESFSVALIPHTLAVTNLGLLQPNDTVNLEVDILAKYVEKLLKPDSDSSPN